MADTWLDGRLAHIRALKSPQPRQKLLLLLSETPDRTPDEERRLKAVIRAEKAAEAAQKAQAKLNSIETTQQRAARKKRDHELFLSGGLLIMAGLVDTKTGAPSLDRGELLGALIGLSKVKPDDPRRAEWKRAGDALLAERSAA